jgi:hypothetical protein
MEMAALQDNTVLIWGPGDGYLFRIDPHKPGHSSVDNRPFVFDAGPINAEYAKYVAAGGDGARHRQLIMESYIGSLEWDSNKK